MKATHTDRTHCDRVEERPDRGSRVEALGPEWVVPASGDIFLALGAMDRYQGGDLRCLDTSWPPQDSMSFPAGTTLDLT